MPEPTADLPTPDREQAFANTDRELWREGDPDDGMSYYEPSLHVTERGGIGINVGGMVYVKTLREWHALAAGREPLSESTADLLRLIYECPADLMCGPCRRRIGELAERAEEQSEGHWASMAVRERERREKAEMQESADRLTARAEQAEKERDEAVKARDAMLAMVQAEPPPPQIVDEITRQTIGDLAADRDRLAAALEPLVARLELDGYTAQWDLVKIAREALSPGATQEQTQ